MRHHDGLRLAPFGTWRFESIWNPQNLGIHIFQWKRYIYSCQAAADYRGFYDHDGDGASAVAHTGSAKDSGHAFAQHSVAHALDCAAKTPVPDHVHTQHALEDRMVADTKLKENPATQITENRHAPVHAHERGTKK
jgi:hypothetical protein